MRVSEPVDWEHLATYTLGDRALEGEVAQLFADQAPKLRAHMLFSADLDERSQAFHTLKGAASALGAFRLAELCRTADMRARRALEGRETLDEAALAAEARAAAEELDTVLMFLRRRYGDAA